MSCRACGVCLRTWRQKIGSCFLFLLVFLGYLAPVPFVWSASEDSEGQRTWKTLSELSPDELTHVDLRTDTPRHAEYSYLPAEPYPFTAALHG